MGEKVLEVEHLRTEFKQEKKKYVTAINDVSFTLNEGEIVGLVGESGCGKSVTSLSIIWVSILVTGFRLLIGSWKSPRRKDEYDFPGSDEQPEPGDKNRNPDDGNAAASPDKG